MFYREESDQYIQEGVPFVVDGIQYPSTWLNTSTPEEKAALGLQEVVVIGYPANQMYYWVSEVLDKATLTITNTPKDMSVVRPLAKKQLEQQAYSLLFPSDWMITRKVETGTELQPEWSTYRDNIRLEVIVVRGQIDNANTVDEIAIIQPNWPISPNSIVVKAETPAE